MNINKGQGRPIPPASVSERVSKFESKIKEETQSLESRKTDEAAKIVKTGKGDEALEPAAPKPKSLKEKRISGSQSLTKNELYESDSKITPLRRKALPEDKRLALKMLDSRVRNLRLEARKLSLNLADEPGKEAYDEKVYQTMRELYFYSKTLVPGDEELFNQLVKLDNELAILGKDLPRPKDILKAPGLGEEALKPTLKETINHLFEGLPPEMTKGLEANAKRDRLILRKTESQIKLDYAKRLAIARRVAWTSGKQVSLSTIGEVESQWKKFLESKPAAAEERKIGDRLFIFLPNEKGLYLKGKVITESGAFKVPFILHSILTQRSDSVIKQPKEDVKEQLPSFKAAQAAESEKGKEKELSTQSSDVEKRDYIDEDEDLGTTVHKDEDEDLGTTVLNDEEEDLGTIVQKDEDEDLGTTVQNGISKDESEESAPAREQMKFDFTKFIRDRKMEEMSAGELKERADDKQAFSVSFDQDEYTKYKNEANLQLQLTGQRGIWVTKAAQEMHVVTTLTEGEPKKSYILIESAAKFKTESGNRVYDLYNLLQAQEEGILNKSEQIAALTVLEDSLFGIQHIHEQGILHRDLKLQNILTGREGRGGISDFGEFCLIKGVENKEDPRKATSVGSPYMFSPEMAKQAVAKESALDPTSPPRFSGVHPLEQWKLIDDKSDVWSVGMMLWQATTGKEPREHPAYAHSNSLNAKNSVNDVALLLTSRTVREKYNQSYAEPQNKTGIAHLVWECTRVDPDQRPSMDVVASRFSAWKKETAQKLDRGQIKNMWDNFN
ncbi:protein kinase domain-containing protein [Criblamydia sequanensis]|uniref:Serine/threonine protein kinase n=1 Tax=Candidatus Criblamydia sequanensis CRIB-18 TaxID=1437425 RepID=A0A090DXM6_9BACT|nr:protein kinase [Criblamydia sequanensis]CDR33559.1 Serine/threonine protein kinase [Criblamydia sequanensis CRIB-18]